MKSWTYPILLTAGISLFAWMATRLWDLNDRKLVEIVDTQKQIIQKLDQITDTLYRHRERLGYMEQRCSLQLRTDEKQWQVINSICSRVPDWCDHSRVQLRDQAGQIGGPLWAGAVGGYGYGPGSSLPGFNQD